MTEKIMHKKSINYFKIENLYENEEDLITCEISGKFYYNFQQVGELISIPIILPCSETKIGIDFPKNLPSSFSYLNRKIHVEYFLVFKKYFNKQITISKEKIIVENDFMKAMLNSNFILDKHNFFIETYTENFIHALRQNEKIDEDFLKGIILKQEAMDNYAHKKAVLIKNLGCIFLNFPNIFCKENNVVSLTYECKIMKTVIRLYREESTSKSNMSQLLDQYDFISENLYKYNFYLDLKNYGTFSSNLVCVNYFLEFDFDSYVKKIKINIF